METGERITPAYAGKTCELPCRPSRKQDHPRLRGENRIYLLCGLLFTGSPPPTRGKRHEIMGMATQAGITPAYAGKTGIFSRPSGGGGDHPRLRGENRSSYRKTFDY